MSQRAFPVLALLALGTVAYQQSRIGNFPPAPSVFVGVALIFSLLAVLAVLSPELSSALALAVVLWLVFAYHGVLTKPSSGGT